MTVFDVLLIDRILNGAKRKTERETKLAAQNAERDALYRAIDPEFMELKDAEKIAKDSSKYGTLEERKAAWNVLQPLLTWDIDKIRTAMPLLNELRVKRLGKTTA
jgi:hypothetical protein